MDIKQYITNLSVPQNKVDVVLDTDTFNEVDDQFALAYMLASKEKLNVKAVYAAPFLNEKSESPKDGMNKSYDEIIRILKLAGHEELIDNTYRGSERYLENETVGVISPAACDLAERAKNYSPENPLYVIAIGAITNVASALLINPEAAENIVVVWLGGHALDYSHTKEFNMCQDIAAARVVFGCGVPLVQLPCCGVVHAFSLPYQEMEHFLKGKNELCDFLLKRVRENESEKLAADKAVARVIWDVTAVGWLLNTNNRFMESRLIHSPVPEYDNRYSYDESRHFINYVYFINRNELANDLYEKLVTLQTCSA
ncbi:MAG: nucleoside hydrolase [Clostridia bacterium]|nr:nucleoside hydrolase [Clostridia bacterium]